MGQSHPADRARRFPFRVAENRVHLGGGVLPHLIHEMLVAIHHRYLVPPVVLTSPTPPDRRPPAPPHTRREVVLLRECPGRRHYRSWPPQDTVLAPVALAHLRRAVGCALHRFHDGDKLFVRCAVTSPTFGGGATAFRDEDVRGDPQRSALCEPRRAPARENESRSVASLCTQRGETMQATKVGIREFRENLASYLDSKTPVAITRHGATIGSTCRLGPNRARRIWRLFASLGRSWTL